jgi:2-oxo-4-hydroxy-4-carboxy-5-ureidoimidazoline decarboxylase
MTLAELNAVPRYRAEAELTQCCGSRAWVRAVAGRRPFHSLDRLLKAASEVWWGLDEGDWREAFGAHPQIGARKVAAPAGQTQAEAPAPPQQIMDLEAKWGRRFRLPTSSSTTSQAWPAQEQAGMGQAGVAVTMGLEEANRVYLTKFGYIFIVCAMGKTAEDMLAILRARLLNSPEQEIRTAAEEQDKITRLRLEKLLTP